MNIEIVEFYPLKRNEVKGILTGTLRIKLPDIGIHILGIYVSKRKDAWFFNLPGRHGTNHQTGEAVRYPFIVFEDREQQRALMDAIREQGRTFIEKRLADTENPLVFPQSKPKQPQARDNSIITRKTAATVKTKPSPAQTILSKEWQDPPARKPAFQITAGASANGLRATKKEKQNNCKG